MKMVIFLILFVSLTSVAETVHYFGEDIMKSPDGSITYSVSPKLLKRIVDKSAGQIYEEVILKEYQGGYAKKQIVITVEDSYRFKITGDIPKGSGYFFGAPWKWTGWVSLFELNDGAQIRVVDYLSDDALLATSEYYSKDSILVSVTYTKLNQIESQTYEILKNNLLNK